MRYSLQRMLVAMTLASVYAGVAFGAPHLLAVLLLGIANGLMPAVYAGGVIYSRRSWRAFWIGTAACGMLPSLLATWVYLQLLFDFELDDWTRLLDRSDDAGLLVLRIYTVAIQLLPLLGGVACVLMRSLFKPQRSIMPESGVTE
ncbi:hypothetical protein NG895_06475 [Aeoliella sp. ICT_H6.2]|uniref:Uncharacterized protein n=1 Tax=Aeoliella straminimaris TaxID=2954799 RepID=A0A9X2F8B3_9BACT|nr:hypothetical protein [Aeoliella straminimaris]MCO6043548.1 hypothetical protein [Aeoliella straminimaris]